MQELKVILVGNPNTGKTSLFNKLTNSNEHVGNWHGVTVEEKEKTYYHKGEKISLVDLPGLYSLTTLSYEENVSRDYLFKHEKEKIINLCDSNNIERNLYLTLNLLEYGFDVVLAINQTSSVGNKIDYKKLSKKLGINVVNVNAKSGEGLGELNDAIMLNKRCKELPYLKKLNLHIIKDHIRGYFPKNKLDFYAIKCFERDEQTVSSLPQKVLEKIETFLPENSLEVIARLRYEFIDEILNECVVKTKRTYGKSKLDNIFLNKFLAFPIFLLILTGVFYFTFFSFGKWISDALLWGINNLLGQPIKHLFVFAFGKESWVTSLFCDAVLGGVGTLFSFLPQIVLLFMFLSILEDSGYLARVAFMFEDILGKVGLSGKSVYTILMGFGCSSSAVLTARNMEDENAKIKTALLTPYMSCSAKLPLYIVIGGAFFGAKNIFYILFLYLLGVLISVLMSYIFEKTVLKSKEQSFILEFPPYRGISVKRILKVLWENIRLFVSRVGILLICVNIIIWILSNFSFSLAYVPSSNGSMLQKIGEIISPIFIPLGFGEWGFASALIAGLIAKEVILSSVIMFNGVNHGEVINVADSLKDPSSNIYFPAIPNVVSFLIFTLLYSPCVTTMAILRKEIGKKWTVIGVLIQFAVAYLLSLFVFNVINAFEDFGLFPVLLILLVIILIMFSFIFLFERLTRKRHCEYACPNYEKCKRKKS